jgi:hypothetical protein
VLADQTLVCWEEKVVKCRLCGLTVKYYFVPQHADAANFACLLDYRGVV